MLVGARLERLEQPLEVGDQDVGRAHELHAEAGIEHVGRGHALVHEARFRTDDLGEMREEGDDVVLRHLLDGVDARDVELVPDPLFPDGVGGLARYDADVGHGGGRMRLDLEPDSKACLRLPDAGHLGTGVARDHVGLFRSRRGFERLLSVA